MPYTPRPIDTEGIVLPESLQPLVERLAEHVHDTWAAGRLADGWTYGPQRDDDAKTHPGLVPYADLSDAEQEYDRRTALGTLEAMAALGYRIHKPDLGNASSDTLSS